jgi:predicted metal-binding membrane protein
MSEARLSTRPGFGPAIPPAAVLGLLAAAGWALLASGATGPMSHDALLGSGQLPHLAPLLAFLGNWQLMVAATMLPLAIPAIAARACRTGRPWAATGAVVATTGVVWTGFAVAVLAGDSVVHRLVAQWPWLEEREWLVSSAVLVLAGLVQLAPFQRRALASARRAASPPWRYALSCLASCWALMLVMFAVALESLLWMAVLAVVMTVERVTAHGSRLAPLAGIALISLAVLSPLHLTGFL